MYEANGPSFRGTLDRVQGGLLGSAGLAFRETGRWGADPVSGGTGYHVGPAGYLKKGVTYQLADHPQPQLGLAYPSA